MKQIHYITIIFLFFIHSFPARGSSFEIKSLSSQAQLKMTKSHVWQEGCPLPLSRLHSVTFSYYNFEGEEKNDGVIIVMDAASSYVLDIFKELHALKFPIAKSKPVEYYAGNDEASMYDNNTSSFNCRISNNGKGFSIHSYGLAIDLNPVQNPYIAFEVNGAHSNYKILPINAKTYMKRNIVKPGMAEKVVEIFSKNGFTIWGGKRTPIDWQHFEVPYSLARLLAHMSSEDATRFFELAVKTHTKLFYALKPDFINKLLRLYQRDPQHFLQTFEKHIKLFHTKPMALLDTLSREIQ